MTLEERARAHVARWGASDDAIPMLLAFAAEERERCADYLDGYAGGHYMAQLCASAIRNMEQGQ